MTESRKKETSRDVIHWKRERETHIHLRSFGKKRESKKTEQVKIAPLVLLIYPREQFGVFSVN